MLKLLFFACLMTSAFAQSDLLTVVLQHDQSKNVDEIQEIQNKQGFYKNFPPAGTKVVSWYVMMGLGQVVTLEVPAGKLREVNLTLEKTAWKAFKTKFYPTYDLYPVIREKLSNKEGPTPQGAGPAKN